MEEQFYSILTKTGKAKIANASALGTKVNFATFVLGDGGGSYYNPTEDQTMLKNQVWSGPVNNLSIDKDNNNWVVAAVSIPADIGNFMIREAGILDDEGNLLVIGKYPETYKPIAINGSTKDLTIRMILEVSNTAIVTLKVDPTVTFATQKDITNLQNEISNINVPTKASDIGAVATSQVGVTGGVAKQDDLTILDEEVKSHEADYMYQIPQIVGTQIRINKLSDTNRLFFKLDSDLSDGAITISTDGGTTSKPLQDINGTAITTLEKGFVEVVADATFFTLRNRGISATQKQQLIDIVNNADVNQSTIKTNIANVLNSKVGSSLTSSSAWIDIQNAISNMPNKRWKVGSGNAGSTSYSFKAANGSASTSFFAATVTGLTFKPTRIFVYATYGSVGIYTDYMLDRKIGGFTNGDIMTGQTTSDGSNGTSYGVSSANSPVSITSTGFMLPFQASANNQAFNWIAFE